LESLQQLLALSVLVVLVSTLGVSQVYAAENFATYENSDMGVKMDYPADWVIDDSLTGSVMFYAPQDGPNDQIGENMGLVVEYLIEPTSLDEYTNIFTEGYQFAGFSTGDVSSITLGDSPAKKIEAFMEIEGQRIDQTIFVTIKNDAAFLLIGTSVPQTNSKFLPIFDTMKDSFEFLSESETTGQDVRKLISDANQLYLQGLLHDALSKLDTALIIQPNNYDALILKGSILVDLGKNTEAEQIADEILETSGYDVSAILIKSLALYEQEKYEEAIEFFDEYLLTAPNDSMVISFKGLALTELGKRDEGLPLIDKALELHPDFPFSIFAKGYYYSIIHDYDQAILYMDKAIGLEPENLEYLNEKGLVLMNQNKKEEALVTFEKILQNNPNHSFALNNKGVILLDRGDNAKAVEYFDMALELEPDNLLFLQNKIAALSSSGITDLAQIAYNQLLQLNPDYDTPLEKISASTTFGASESESTQIDPPSLQLGAGPESTQIPDWVRGNAEWWAQGAIGDSDFVSGIQYLIKEGIMTIPETVKPASGGDSKEIPSWIKNNADWWAQGLISDDDFVKGIQFLIENGIMEV
jgi:tetratricopeptide (TPR) repeat protein